MIHELSTPIISLPSDLDESELWPDEQGVRLRKVYIVSNGGVCTLSRTRIRSGCQVRIQQESWLIHCTKVVRSEDSDKVLTKSSKVHDLDVMQIEPFTCTKACETGALDSSI